MQSNLQSANVFEMKKKNVRGLEIKLCSIDACIGICTPASTSSATNNTRSVSQFSSTIYRNHKHNTAREFIIVFSLTRVDFKSQIETLYNASCKQARMT